MAIVEWEKFLGGPTKSPAIRMHATLTSQYRIHLNRNLYQRLGNPEAVCLYFNREQQMIAVQAASPRLNEAFPVGTLYSKTTRYIPAATFCRHYGIRVNETHRFLDPHFAPDGKLILNLNETVIVSRKRRK